jgi:ketosteroid isomerase-like protein
VCQQIIALEQAALARWSQGDPSGFLELSAPDIVYFDPFIDKRIDGLSALTEYYDGLRGKIFAKHFELMNPVVQHQGTMAVLTFNFLCHPAAGGEQRWNCTEVYRLDETASWKIIQTHWSLTAPLKPVS